MIIDLSNSPIRVSDDLAHLLFMAGVGNPNNPADRAALVTRGGPVLTPAVGAQVDVGRAAGAVIAALPDPFAVLGGNTTFVLSGAAPGQLALSGRNIVVGASALIAGATYSMNVTATSYDGKRVATGTSFVTALGATEFSASLAPGAQIAAFASLFTSVDANSSYAIVGTGPNELAISANGVIIGNSPPAVGKTYTITIAQTGKYQQTITITFIATA